MRTNLTALLESPANEIIPFPREKEVGLVGFLPCYGEENVDAQRGHGAYQKTSRRSGQDRSFQQHFAEKAADRHRHSLVRMHGRGGIVLLGSIVEL